LWTPISTKNIKKKKIFIYGITNYITMKKIEISDYLYEELSELQKAMSDWSGYPISVDTVLRQLIQWYYLSINYPTSRWRRELKDEPKKLMSMKYQIRNGMPPTSDKQLSRFIKELKAEHQKN